MLFWNHERSVRPPDDQYEGLLRWEHPPPNSHLLGWVTQERCRFFGMACCLLLALLLALLSLGAVLPRRADEHHVPDGVLRFTSDGSFQISIFEDLHFGENAWDQWGPQQDVWSTYIQNQVLDAESPQLAVLNGDLITGENTFLENSTDYIAEIVAPFVQRNIPFASTYGNHDSAFNLSRERILAHERLHSNCYTTQMLLTGTSGVSNYFLPIYPYGSGAEPLLLLWFFDSRGGWEYQQLDASGDMIGKPNWVDQTVVDWFKKTSNELSQRYGRTIPSLAFVHIPTNASQALQTEAGMDPHHQPGINDDCILAQQSQGWCADGSNEPYCIYGGQDVPFMEAITSTPGMMALFSGHDHGDTWCYKWDGLLPGMTVEGNGINLCFGQHSGYGGYGTWTRGSRQVLVTESMLGDFEVDTWIRLETGEVVGSVTLNATYNRDWYPATEDSHTQCPTCEY